MNVDWIKKSVSVRVFMIGMLTLILLIPAAMVESLVNERQARQAEAINEVSSKWGKTQLISGPLLAVPVERSVLRDNQPAIYNEVAYFLPEQLDITSKVVPEIRYRGIYEVVLYNSKIFMKGRFNTPINTAMQTGDKKFQWDRAVLLLGISDLRGIRDTITLRVDEKDLSFTPGVEMKDLFATGITASLDADKMSGDFEYTIALDLNGSGGLLFTPLGKTTTATVSSGWNNPSFSGEYLPEQREITENGFEASWKILNFNRNYPQEWIGQEHMINDSQFGVNLLIPVDQYQKNTRSAKYAIMFIALTFLAFFMIEILNNKLIHPLQYLLIGLSLLVFYTLLLSISEQLSFNSAYIIASLAIISIIGAYSAAVLKNNKQTTIIVSILVLLYGYLYVVLQLQDYALLLGSIGLFIIISMVMYLTRKVDWYNIPQRKQGVAES